jgi:hypothetical protein
MKRAAGGVGTRSRLEIRETDIAVRIKREAPLFVDCDFGDFAPLPAYGNVRAEDE